MNNKTVVIIGGSSGIGFEVAKLLNQQGARLIIVGRNPDKLSIAIKHLGNASEIAILDAHDEIALEIYFSNLKGIDHLVSLIGDSMSGGFVTTSTETMNHVLHSKFYTNWLIAKYAASKMMEGGSMTFTAGTGGRPQDISASYVANLGVRAMVEGLAVELAPKIRVNAVSPTFMGVQTDFWKDMPPEEIKKAQAEFIKKVPLQRLGTPAEVATAYVYLMTNSFITGQVLNVDGGVMLTV
ncbi:MAG TPA: SDR family oxidoreductase [Chitinophagaceae bacterium]|nr:SDR family oxidoreductase [Chitinophagaceae bacterium]